MFVRRALLGLLVIAGFAYADAPAFAQATRTWVSGVGALRMISYFPSESTRRVSVVLPWILVTSTSCRLRLGLTAVAITSAT